MGRRERYYFGGFVLVVVCGMVLAHTAPNAIGPFSGLVGAIAVPVYGGALGKLWMEMKNGNGQALP